jgi:hypothetical protein
MLQVADEKPQLLFKGPLHVPWGSFSASMERSDNTTFIAWSSCAWLLCASWSPYGPR